MSMGYELFFIPVFTVIFAAGLFIFFKPALAIKFQIKFYEKINWRMEPIDMRKEIRNTRIMGAFLIITALFIIIQYFV